jgi:hypothetical protein
MALRAWLVAIALLTSGSEYVFTCETDVECAVQDTEVSFSDINWGCEYD